MQHKQLRTHETRNDEIWTPKFISCYCLKACRISAKWVVHQCHSLYLGEMCFSFIANSQDFFADLTIHKWTVSRLPLLLYSCEACLLFHYYYYKKLQTSQLYWPEAKNNENKLNWNKIKEAGAGTDRLYCIISGFLIFYMPQTRSVKS